MSPRLRRAVRRLFWTLVRVGVRSACWGAARVITTAVAVECAADRAQGLALPPVAWSGTGYPPAPDPILPPPPPPEPQPWYHPSTREQSLAVFCGTQGRGLFIVNDDHAALLLDQTAHC